MFCIRKTLFPLESKALCSSSKVLMRPLFLVLILIMKIVLICINIIDCFFSINLVLFATFLFLVFKHTSFSELLLLIFLQNLFHIICLTNRREASGILLSLRASSTLFCWRLLILFLSNKLKIVIGCTIRVQWFFVFLDYFLLNSLLPLCDVLCL